MNAPRPTYPRLAAVLVAVLALLLAGCGGNDDDTSAKKPTSSASAGTGSGDAVNNPSSSIDNGLNEASVTAQEDVFSVLSPWNRTVTDAKVNPRSDTLIANTKIRVGRRTDGTRVQQTIDEGVYINTDAWTVPVVADGTPTVVHCRQEKCGDGDDDFTLNIPDDVDPATIYDGWYTVFDEQNRTAYDFWRARREDDGTLSYQFVQIWDLDGPGFKQPYIVSARGSGLPLFAGLIRPGELERCQINHALAISLPGPASGSFIQPASSTDGNGLRGALPEGARIRLSPDFLLRPAIDELTGKRFPVSATQQRNADCIVKTLQTYGAIVVDRAAVPTLYFQRIDTGRREPLLNGYELQSMRLDDFDALDFSAADRFAFPQPDETTNSNRASDTTDNGSTETSTDTSSTDTSTGEQ